MIDLKNLTIEKAHDHLINGDFSAIELARAYQDEIKKKNPELHAYLEVFSDIDEQARVADKKIKDGKAEALTGIPFSIKDNILIKGRIASASSKMLENYKATYDATVISKLKEQGVVFLGRTNMDEFAMGGSTENSAYGPTKNPHDTSRVPGGSSGGAAASVAGNLALAALGSDTGGSIRQPAAFCGAVGLKPSYGAVSRSGLMAMASSLDQIGPITKTVADAEIIFNTIKGRDGLDSTSIDMPKPSQPGKSSKISDKKTFRIGIPRDFLKAGIDKDVLENFEQSLKQLESLGHSIVDISLSNLPYALPVYYVIMPAEVSSNLARFDGVKYGLLKESDELKNLLGDYIATRGLGFGKETRRRIMLGTYVLSTGYYDAYYNKANVVRSLLVHDFDESFKKIDIIAMPTTPTPAFKIGEKSGDPLSMYLADIFTVSANLVGVPAISIPSGVAVRDGKSLPLGLQFIAGYDREDQLFSLGRDFEKNSKK